MNRIESPDIDLYICGIMIHYRDGMQQIGEERGSYLMNEGKKDCPNGKKRVKLDSYLILKNQFQVD